MVSVSPYSTRVLFEIGNKAPDFFVLPDFRVGVSVAHMQCTL